MSKKGVSNATMALIVSILLLLIIFGFFMLKLKGIGSTFGWFYLYWLFWWMV